MSSLITCQSGKVRAPTVAGKDPDELLGLDQRQAWWRAWGEATGEALDGVPAALDANPQLLSNDIRNR